MEKVNVSWIFYAEDELAFRVVTDRKEAKEFWNKGEMEFDTNYDPRCKPSMEVMKIGKVVRVKVEKKEMISEEDWY